MIPVRTNKQFIAFFWLPLDSLGLFKDVAQLIFLQYCTNLRHTASFVSSGAKRSNWWDRLNYVHTNNNFVKLKLRVFTNCSYHRRSVNLFTRKFIYMSNVTRKRRVLLYLKYIIHIQNFWRYKKIKYIQDF